MVEHRGSNIDNVVVRSYLISDVAILGNIFGLWRYLTLSVKVPYVESGGTLLVWRGTYHNVEVPICYVARPCDSHGECGYNDMPNLDDVIIYLVSLMPTLKCQDSL